MHVEAELSVQAHCWLVVGIDVEHPGGHRSGEMCEPGDRQRSPEALAMEVGVGRDHVDLAERCRPFVVARVDLRPAEPGHPPVSLVDQEPGRVEPRLVLTSEQVFLRPAALLGVPVERGVVHREPRILVPPRFEWSGHEIGPFVERERHAHLPQVPSRLEPDRRRDASMGVGRLVHPVMDVTAALGSDEVGGFAEQAWRDLEGVVSMVRIDDQVDRPRLVAARDLRIGEQMIVTGFAEHEPGEFGPPAVRSVDPPMLVHRLVTVGRAHAPDEVLDLGHVASVELSLDHEVSHAPTTLSTGTVAAVARSRLPNPDPPDGRRRPRTAAGRAKVTHEFLAEDYPGTAVDLCELDHRNPFELLVATILSAQCTDERVNLTTPEVFRRWPDAVALAQADTAELEEVIHATGFFRQKAKSLQGMARRLLDEHGGDVPHRLKDLVALPGVGRKTANVIRSVALDEPGLPVDTHVGRLAIRLGLTEETDPVKVESALNSMVPADERGLFSLRLILHGRRVCAARRASCGECSLAWFCPSFGATDLASSPHKKQKSG